MVFPILGDSDLILLAHAHTMVHLNKMPLFYKEASWHCALCYETHMGMCVCKCVCVLYFDFCFSLLAQATMYKVYCVLNTESKTSLSEDKSTFAPLCLPHSYC